MKKVKKNHLRASVWSFERNLTVWSRAGLSIGKCKENFDTDSWTYPSVLMWQVWKIGLLDCYIVDRGSDGGKKKNETNSPILALSNKCCSATLNKVLQFIIHIGFFT